MKQVIKSCPAAHGRAHQLPGPGKSRSIVALRLRASIDAQNPLGISKVIALNINGQQRSFSTPLTVANLIEQLELQGKRIALERNGEIVPRGQFGLLELSDGDALEIVVAVGGG